ncbi:hypothetical protein VTP01DRAFT_1976 [Rhizomucor pusillus]|uniref:uncharacterized protein n=1 Tax=Rhizomucor pusillus TaxID=4840 RepID=UPI0037447686
MQSSTKVGWYERKLHRVKYRSEAVLAISLLFGSWTRLEKQLEAAPHPSHPTKVPTFVAVEIRQCYPDSSIAR